MAMNDPLGDMLTRIRNAQMRNKPKVSTPGSKLRAARARRAASPKAISAAMPRVEHDGRPQRSSRSS